MRALFQVMAIGVAGFIASLAQAGEVVDICSVKTQGERALGMHVSFSGKIRSDGMHSTLILPNECNTYGYSMAPGEKDNSPSTIVMQAVLGVGAPGTVDKDVAVVVEAEIVKLGNGKMGLKVTQLKRLTVVYPSADPS